MNKDKAVTKFSFERYLRAKVSVDAISFNQGVWDGFVEQINNVEHTHLQVLEIGGGIGTMAKKFIDQFSSGAGNYLIVEQNSKLAKAAKNNLIDWADNVEDDSDVRLDDHVRFHARKGNWTIQFVEMDIYSWMALQDKNNFLNVLIGHAILDLLDTSKFFAKIAHLLKEQALLYFPINYDGLSIFEPQDEAKRDEEIWRLYHQSMDQRLIGGKRSGDSQSGRHLFGHLQTAGLQVLMAGSSDWLIFPKNNVYTKNERYFLLHIIKTIEDELGDHPQLDKKDFRQWIELRKEQVLSGKLMYLAHQIDVLAVLPMIKSS